MAHSDNIATALGEVPPGAFRRRDWIAQAQVWLALVTVAGTLACWAWKYFRDNEGGYSPGPVAHVHASWEERCSVCHVTAQPLAANNWTRLAFHDPRSADPQCQACHAGPAHHASERAADIPGCTACHLEHRGRDSDLKRVANRRCLACHRDLASHARDGSTVKFLDVSGFDGNGHPELRLFRDQMKDPGTIAFNHKLHLVLGLCEAEKCSVPFTLADVPVALREQYRRPGVPEEAPLQLTCASCHQTDAGGATIVPVTYERHCQACHPLTFAPKVAGQAPGVPHRLQPRELGAWLRGYFTDRLRKDELSLLDVSARPLPGKDPEREAKSRKLGEILEGRINAAQRILFGPNTCGKCHSGFGKGTIAERIEPHGIPATWLTHARFDHSAHRGLDCTACHRGAASSRVQADLLVPALDACQSCHAPPTQQGDALRGGARFDCVECHRYHGGDHPTAGRGAESRRPHQGGAEIQRFLQGESRQP